MLLIVALGCGPGGDKTDQSCESQVVPGTHARGATASFLGYSCDLQCEPGYSDCDHDISNGCEKVGVCSSFDAGFGDAPYASPPELVMTLVGGAAGFSACDSALYVLQSDALYVVDATGALAKLAASPPPAGGLACDGTMLYWPVRSNGALPNGAIFSFDIVHSQNAIVTGNIDPGAGVDVRAHRVYWVARSDAGAWLSSSAADSGVTSDLPIMETGAYKPFALTSGADWTITSPSTIAFASLVAGAADASSDADADADADASTSSGAITLDAAVTSLVANPARAFAVVGSSLVAADDPSFVQASGVANVTLGATYGDSVVLASDDTVYVGSLSPKGALAAVPGKFLHVVAVTTKGSAAYWITRGEGATPGAIWTVALQ